MGNYKLNNVSIESYGIIPIQSGDTNLAITGAWDMPARIGKTFHDWGNDQDGIEPYVLASEIRFGGIDISLDCVVRGLSKNDALRKCYALFTAIDAYNGLVVLQCDWGTWNVLVNGEIKGEYLQDGITMLTIPFRCPIVPMPTALPINALQYNPLTDQDGIIILVNNEPIYGGSIKYDGYGIDGVMFAALGLIITSITDRFSRPVPKSGQVTSYRNEGYRNTTTKEREITINAAIVQPSYADFVGVVDRLKALFSKPGLRYLTREQDALRDFFVKDGFKITGLRVNDGQVVAFIAIKLTEVSAHLDWNILTTPSGNIIETEIGNIIIT
ncbi:MULTISPECIES: hypothetical protein [unclassified Pedobacter]|uniref:hypothetical protein n=1 Tax=unclassified Pedobacter TaxID=2628915 RepID=UPI00141F4185|nr:MULTISPECIES: hypothetical protein [unclassified Pedobacter]NII81755.1 hypothetical protein [Pedobacter sp. SG908]NMN35757.1 hypothetical protein [Pedobacter sp. SG918]